jgi:rhamnosyltransferase
MLDVFIEMIEGLETNVIAVLVSYNPSHEITDNIMSVLPQVDKLIIVDNASNNDSKKIFEHLTDKKISIIYNQDNYGIAAALNIGIKHALQLGAKWILTLDQDSKISSTFIEKMLTTYYKIPNHNSIVLISPIYLDKTGSTQHIFKSNKSIRDVYFSYITTAITSGSLYRSDIFDKIGFFKEKFFIDYVDHEYCLRIKRNNLDIIQVYSAIIYHALGNPSIINMGPFSFLTTNHSALRRYYMARNRIYVYKEYFSTNPIWIFRDLLRFISELGKIVLFEKQKIQKVYKIIKGVYDGLTSKP